MSMNARLAALLLVAALAPACSLDKPAWREQKAANDAEAAFYLEHEHEGRLYVFGTSKTWNQFQATQEMPYCVTFIGGGPGGKTVKLEAEAKEHALQARLRREFEKRHGPLAE
jgi:hypothetical protein